MTPSPLATGNPLLDHIVFWAVILGVLGGGNYRVPYYNV